jgi:hypothetical protein
MFSCQRACLPSPVLLDRWVQGECRSIGEFDAPEVDSILQVLLGPSYITYGSAMLQQGPHARLRREQ